MRKKKNYLPNVQPLLRLITLWIASFISVAIYSQGRMVTGTITDIYGNSMPGVSVIIKGTTTGTVTDLNGKFSIRVPSDESVLTFSFIGYKTQEVVVGQQSDISLKLEEEVKEMDEVVVVGYGTMKKKLVTGANVHLSSDEMSKKPVLRVEQALQGLSSGVFVSSTSGQPGSALKVVVRGVGTIGDASPLYVVDGVPVGDISYIDPNNIESVDVLKDAASAAIYGVRAANGVVLITTKKGKSGDMKVSYDGYYGIQSVIKKIDMLNASEFTQLMNEAYYNTYKRYDPKFTFPTDANGNIDPLFLDTIANTNWQDYLFRNNVPIQSHTVSVSGGNDRSTYFASGTYFNQEGIAGAKNMSYFERMSGQINSNHKVKEYLSFGENITITHTRSSGIGVGNIYDNTVRGFLNATPIFPVYDETKSDGYGKSWKYPDESNPFASMNYKNNRISRNYNLIGNAFVILEPLKNLKIKSDFGFNFGSSESNKYTIVYNLSNLDINNRNTAEQSMYRNFGYNWENYVSYNLISGQHNAEVLVGNTINESSAFWVGGSKQNLTIDDFDHAIIDNATFDSTRNVYGSKSDDALLSYFARANYNYNEKYLLSVTYRRDGSTRFGPESRWGNFWSFSGGWIVSQEDFFKNNIKGIDYLKLRASWGQNGNDKIPAFSYLALIDFSDKFYYFGEEETKYIGAAPARIENTKLRWEDAEQLDIGFDARFLKNFSLAFDYYNKIQRGWLIIKPVPQLVGILNDNEYPIVNGGDVRNKGFEIELGYQKEINDFNLSIKANFAKNTNKVIDIPNNEGVIHGQTNVLYNGCEEIYRAQEGYPVGFFYGYKTNGLFQTQEEVDNYLGVDSLGNPILDSKGNQVKIQPKAEPGDVRFVDINKDGKIDEKDKTMIGNPYPDYTYGLLLSAGYKGFDLSATIQGVYGNDIVYGVRTMDRDYNNWDTEILERWTGPGTSNRIPRATLISQGNLNWKRFSDLYIYDGSYLKVRSISLGYDFAHKLLKKTFTQFRLYFTLVNPIVITNYKGLDPEVGYGNSTSSENMSTGIDLGTYPQPRQYLVGLNIKF